MGKKNIYYILNKKKFKILVQHIYISIKLKNKGTVCTDTCNLKLL